MAIMVNETSRTAIKQFSETVENIYVDRAGNISPCKLSLQTENALVSLVENSFISLYQLTH